MKNYHYFVAVVFFITLHYSCSEKTKDPDPKEQICLADSVVNTNGVFAPSKKVNIFNDKNRLIELRNYYNQEGNGKTEFKYDQAGRFTSMLLSYQDGSRLEERIIEYDEQGKTKQVRITSYAPYVNLVKRIVYFYETDRITTLQIIDTDTIFKSVQMYNKGNKVQEQIRAGSIITVDTVEYGPRLFKQHSDPNVSLMYTGVLPSNNLYIRREIINMNINQPVSDGTGEYEFNDKGYVTKKTSNVDGLGGDAWQVSQYYYQCN